VKVYYIVADVCLLSVLAPLLCFTRFMFCVIIWIYVWRCWIPMLIKKKQDGFRSLFGIVLLRSSFLNVHTDGSKQLYFSVLKSNLYGNHIIALDTRYEVATLVDVKIMISYWWIQLPYFSIDNAHLMYNTHSKLVRHSFWCTDNAHDAN
jgi:hypothetical protein